MSYEMILIETHDRVGLVRLNRPETLNALNGQLMVELSEALAAFDGNDDIGAMVVTGNERVFAAGADINEMVGKSPTEMLDNTMLNAWDRIRVLHKPLIAAVSGFALGGGCELAMMCDMTVASSKAIFGQPEINLGVIPGAGGTQRLTHAVGKALAMEMVLNDRRLSAEEALRFGLVNHMYPVEAYLEETLKLANKIAARAPVALRLAKEAINKAYETTLAEGLAFERQNFYFLFSTDDQSEGMDAFVNKRKPAWKGQ